MRVLSRFLLPGALFALLLAGCGGGGGAAPALPTDLGLLASTVPSTVDITFVNPSELPATVTQADATGGFRIDPADLPAAVGGGASFPLGVQLLATGPGPAQGTITLAFQDAQGTTTQERAFTATAESVLWQVFTPTLDFGSVEVGQSKDLLASFRNASSLSPVQLTSVSLPSGYQVVGAPFPLTVAPAATGVLTLRFAPTSSGNHDGNAVVGPADAGGPITVQLQGTAPDTADEIVTEFGTQAFSGSDTSLLQVDVPADAISLSVEALGSASSQFGLGQLTGPGGKVYENQQLTGAYIWLPGLEVFSTTVPNTDRTNVQLVPGGGTYSFRIRRLAGSDGSVQVRTIVERRTVAQGTASLLDLNVWLANGIPVTAATAPSDGRLQAILNAMDSILSQQNVRIGNITYYDVANPAYDVVSTDAEFSEMLRTTSAAADVRLNLFFVQTTFTGGVVGVSASISGPKRNGTGLSGVMSVYDGFGTSVVGLIAAHEVGHFLGLYHTVEQNGSHDFVDDTAECPASGTDGVCPVEGGGYLMHWQAVGGTTITGGQGLVVRAHPLLRPAPGGAPKPVPLAPLTLDLGDALDLAGLGDAWCGCPGCAYEAQAGKGLR